MCCICVVQLGKLFKLQKTYLYGINYWKQTLVRGDRRITIKIDGRFA